MKHSKQKNKFLHLQRNHPHTSTRCRLVKNCSAKKDVEVLLDKMKINQGPCDLVSQKAKKLLDCIRKNIARSGKAAQPSKMNLEYCS